MGETVQQIRSRGVKLKRDGGDWTTDYLPYGNRAFNRYDLQIGLKTGLCRIRALTPAIRDSGYGDNTKREYASLKEALSKRYGPGKESEYLRSGALWRESNEWMWSLYDKERVQSVLWDAIESRPNKKNLQAIKLEALGISPSESLIYVIYEFRNANECLQESRSIGDSNL